ncbi:MAG TPA: anion transporter [Burkholderiaceae bacterium]|nr:anion transporter [Burkholderiaceae bacterium]
MHTSVLVIFAAVYAGMLLGGLPLLQLDRTGVALLGAIAIVGVGALTPEQAALAVHLPTILLLFSFMVLAAQMRLGGFYDWVTLRVAAAPLSPAALLAGVIATSAILSAVFSNDVVCLAVAPALADACSRRRLDPVPYLLGLACSANIGSASTLIGNPQNMLIGEVLSIPFATYLAHAAVPTAAGLVATWLVISWQSRGRWALARAPEASGTRPGPEAPEPVALDRWQTIKGLAVAATLVVVFLLGRWPRDVAAVVGAGLLLCSRRLHSRQMLGLVDWELLVLFIGLFVVNRAFADTGLPERALQQLADLGVPLSSPGPLFAATFLLSNVVSNVPAVMLLLPAAHGPLDGAMLALVSTLAGNLFVVGSIANIIVVDASRRRGVAIDWRRHARTGVPVTIVTLGIAAAWLAARPH